MSKLCVSNACRRCWAYFRGDALVVTSMSCRVGGGPGDSDVCKELRLLLQGPGWLVEKSEHDVEIILRFNEMFSNTIIIELEKILLNLRIIFKVFIGFHIATSCFGFFREPYSKFSYVLVLYDRLG